MSSTWYVRSEEGEIYGPVSLSVLRGWAAEGRLGPHEDVSSDQDTWQAAPMLADLDLVWSIRLDDDHVYGPFHIYALPELVEEHHLSYQTEAIHIRSGKRHSLGDLLIPLLLARLNDTGARQTQAGESAMKTLQQEHHRLKVQVESLQQDVSDLETLLARKRHEQTLLSEKAMADHQRMLTERETFTRKFKRMEDEMRVAADYIHRLEKQLEEVPTEEPA